MTLEIINTQIEVGHILQVCDAHVLFSSGIIYFYNRVP